MASERAVRGLFGVLGAVATAVFLSAALLAWAEPGATPAGARSPAPKQSPPALVFNHKAHRDAEIECSYCHTSAEALDGAGIPRLQDCADCHAGIDNTGKEAAKIDLWLEHGAEPPWPALFLTSKWTRFSHKAHVRAEVACATCHGDIGESAAPPTAARQYRMAWCMDCHQQRGASNDCLVCHK